MNYKRIGRALICLILVCALLVNVSPIKAEAVAIESALGIGLAACLILASCGMIYTGLTQNEIIGVGNAFQTHMYQWGTSAEQLDEVDAFFGGLRLVQPPSGGDGDDDDDDWSDFRFTIPKSLQRAIAGFTAGAILAGSLNVENKLEAEEGNKFYGDVELPDFSSLSSDWPAYSIHIMYSWSGNTYLWMGMETMETTAPVVLIEETVPETTSAPTVPETIPETTQAPTVPETVPETTAPEITEPPTTAPTDPEETIPPETIYVYLTEPTEETEEATEPEETTEATETQEITLVQLRDDIVHTNLFSSFLICGTLVGITLCWRLLK